MSAELPLVIDLDGSLLASDLLVESASAYLVARPHGALRIPGWLMQGKAHLKDRLAAASVMDASTLPYHAEVVDWLRAEHALGRSIVLATASDTRLANAVADHLGLFERVIATGNGVNLQGVAKRDALVEAYGHKGFEYLGNSRQDLPVWEAAAVAHVVGGPGLEAKAAVTTQIGRHFLTPGRRLRALVRALRPHQWAKNALVGVPVVLAQRLDEPSAVLHALVAVITFCLAASSAYVLNDLADVTNDRRHPTKRRRPFAAGELSLLTGWVLWPALALVAFVLAALVLSPWFLLVLTTYFVATLTYTFWLKRKAVLDVVTLAGLYTVRIVAGAAAIDVMPTMWLLNFSLLVFLSLALVKRVSELTRIRNEGGMISGRGYQPGDLEMLSAFGAATSIGAAVIFGLYVDDPVTAAQYATPEILFLSIPVLLVWLMRCWLAAHRGMVNEDPILFALRDKASIICGVLLVAAFVAARFVTT